MFCPKCGSDNADNYKFCRICGNPLTVKKPEEEATAQTEAEPRKAEVARRQQAEEARRQQAEAAREKARAAEEHGAPVYTSQPGFVGTPAAGKTVSLAEKAVKAVRSPLTLITILVYTIAIVFAFVAYIQSGVQLGDALSEIPGLDIDFNVAGAGILSTILSQIPAILICLGMWITFVSALRNRPGEISTAGITIIKVLNIIALVLICIGVAILIIGMFGIGAGAQLFFANLSEEISFDRAATAAIVIILIFTAAIMVLVILFFAKVLGTLSWTKAQLLNESSKKSPSLYVAVIVFIIAGLEVIALVASAGFAAMIGSSAAANGYGEIVKSLIPALSGNVFSALINIAFLILAGLLLLKMRKIRNEYQEV